jgi:hypothetical protein
MLRVWCSVIRWRKKSQFVRQLLKRGGVSGGRARVVSTTITGEWSDDRSRNRALLQRSLGEYPM